MSTSYKFYIHSRGPYSTIVKGWIPKHKEFAESIEQLGNRLGCLIHVGYSCCNKGIEDDAPAYEGFFSSYKNAKQFCQIANRKIASFLKKNNL